MTEQERDFKGVWITKEVWLDRRLNALDKIILAEIDSLDKGDDGCWASNQYIAEFCQCSVTKVSTSITKLIEYGYLYVISFDGRTRKLKSRLSKFEMQTIKNSEADYQKLKETNITNKTNTNTKYIKDIVEYLNKKAEKHYRGNNDNTARHINARLNEGYTLDDFFTVIDKKVAEWKGTEMDKYIRPETLFGTKFESYLNAKTPKYRRGANGVLLGDRKSTDLDDIL